MNIKILRAFRPGDIVFLQSDRPLPAIAAEKIDAEFKERATGVTVILLAHGLSIAAREEMTEDMVETVQRWRDLLADDTEAAIQMDEWLKRQC